MDSTPALSVLMFVVAGIFGALGQYLYKSGVAGTSGGLWNYFANGKILAGMFCYFMVMALFVGAFKRGGSMAVLYPVYATTFIWGAIISHFAFGTEIKLVNIAGMATMILGMYLMGR